MTTRFMSGARFDPRLVSTGVGLMFMALVGFAVFGDQANTKVAEVAQPVAQICSQNTAASLELTRVGACESARTAQTGVGPFRAAKDGRDGADGQDGAPGAPGISVTGPSGTPGAPGTPGSPGTTGTPGTSGTDGEPGASPPCLATETRCVGPEGSEGPMGPMGPMGPEGPEGKPGTPGAVGKDGAPGPTCPPGSTLEPVTFASGEEGLGCVTDPAPEAEPTT